MIAITLPEHYYKAEHLRACAYDGFIKAGTDDKEWLTEILSGMNFMQKERAVEKYSEVYLEGGRSEANSRIREFAERCKLLKSGNVIKARRV